MCPSNFGWRYHLSYLSLLNSPTNFAMDKFYLYRFQCLKKASTWRWKEIEPCIGRLVPKVISKESGVQRALALYWNWIVLSTGKSPACQEIAAVQWRDECQPASRELHKITIAPLDNWLGSTGLSVNPMLKGTKFLNDEDYLVCLHDGIKKKMLQCLQSGLHEHLSVTLISKECLIKWGDW